MQKEPQKELLIGKHVVLDRVQEDGIRKYITPDGDKVPSVTTILDATKDKTHLDEYIKRVGKTYADQVVLEASSNGTRMHKFLERFVLDGVWPQPGSNPYSKKANQMAKRIHDEFLVDCDSYIGSEVTVYIPKLYAGTTDLVAIYRGNMCVVDFKQSNKPKKSEWVDDYRYQLVLYIEAYNNMYNTNICEGHIVMCCADLTYQQFDILPNQFKYWRNKALDRVYEYYQNWYTTKY